MRRLRTFKVAHYRAIGANPLRAPPPRGRRASRQPILTHCAHFRANEALAPDRFPTSARQPGHLAPWRSNATGSRQKVRAAVQKSAQRPGELAMKPLHGGAGFGEPVVREQQGGALAAADPSAASEPTSVRIPPLSPRPSASPAPSVASASGRATRTARVNAVQATCGGAAGLGLWRPPSSRARWTSASRWPGQTVRGPGAGRQAAGPDRGRGRPARTPPRRVPRTGCAPPPRSRDTVGDPA